MAAKVGAKVDALWVMRRDQRLRLFRARSPEHPCAKKNTQSPQKRQNKNAFFPSW